MKRTLPVGLVVILAVVARVTLACSKDVDLGAVPDGAVSPLVEVSDGASAADASSDAPIPLAKCDPCVAAEECGAFATCAPVGSAPEGFCLALCPSGGGCDGDDSCRSTKTLTGSTLAACVPMTNACALAPSPTITDGAPLERCGELVAPSVSAECHSCEKSSTNCQMNGCYSGWWCDTDTRRCRRPPTSCN